MSEAEHGRAIWLLLPLAVAGALMMSPVVGLLVAIDRWTPYGRRWSYRGERPA